MNDENQSQQQQTPQADESLTVQQQTTQDTEVKCEKCEEYLALAKRARADYENLKKEMEQWKVEFARFANINLIERLAPVIDNFIVAMEHVPEDQKTVDWVVGVNYIKKQLLDVLKKEGVEFYGKIGDEFNPHLYEAVEEVTAKDGESGKVVKVVSRGCRIGEQVIRPAQVVVGK